MGGDAIGLQGYGLFADWELDIWGRVRSARAANTAGYEATVADTEYARPLRELRTAVDERGRRGARVRGLGQS